MSYKYILLKLYTSMDQSDLFRFIERKFIRNQSIDVFDLIEDGELGWPEPLEHLADAESHVEEEQRLAAGLEVHREGLYGLGGGVVSSVHVRAVYHDGEALSHGVLGDDSPDVVDRGEEEAPVGSHHEILSSSGTLEKPCLHIY